MANVRCPMCSKVNAPDAQVCAFCGARLKPLGTPNSAPHTPASQPQDDEPDWLSGLRGSEPAAPSGEPASTGAEENQDADLPDWLARIRGRARTEGGTPEETFGAEGDAQSADLPDWISRSVSGGESETPAESTSGIESNDDWLTRLQSAESTPFSATGDQPTDLSWLQETPAEDQTGTTPPFDRGGAGSEAAGAEPGADDWMSAFSSWNPDAPQETAKPPAEPAKPADEMSGFGLTGFLSNLEAAEEEKPAEPPPLIETGSSSGFGLTSFLNSLESTEGQQAAAPQEEETGSSGYGLTGFLNNLEGGTEQPAEPAQTSSEDWGTPFNGSAEAPLPDWLSGAEPARSDSQTEIPRGTTGDLASWLASLEGEQPLEPRAQEEEKSESLPGWLASEQGTAADAADAPFTAQTPETSQPNQELPSWLSGTQIEPPAASTPTEPAAASEAVPDWLSDLQPPAAGDTAQVPDWLSETAETTESEADADVPYVGATMEMEGTPAGEPVAEPPSGSGSQPFIDEEAPSWLRDFAAEAPAEAASVPPLLEADQHPQMQAESDQPFAVDLPEWLEEDAQSGKAGETTAAGTPSEDLARAELPSWVAAMRPVESVMPGDVTVQDADQYVEKAGPLSGMRGVLPIAENLLRYRKPPIYSVKLHTTEKQRNQAALLDSIIAQESQPLLIPPGRSHAPHLILRLLLALILVAVVALPNLMQMFGMSFVPLSKPVLQPVELEEMYNQINQGAQQPGEEYTVLLAFDYEPGFSGEMSAAASPVVSHLMQQNARIVVVSTSPNGPALADRLLNSVAGKGNAVGYSLADRSVNLGFLPGGTVSLLEFVRSPQFAAPATIDGRLAWRETFLAGIDRFEDFSQVIVLTDSAETGRAWVEQVTPLMGNIPLFMVASAQAAPLLTPYLNTGGEPNSGQIDGMVTGLMGGAQYGWFANQPNNPASNNWASYQIGIVLAIVLVLAGGLISGFRRVLKRDDKEEA